jgi:MFS family permease
MSSRTPPSALPVAGGAPPFPAALSSVRDPRLYGTDFWLAFLANFLFTSGNSLLFRFADFVAFLGGSAGTAGLVVGLGTGVSLFVRIVQGRVMDRRGPRVVWIVSSLLFVLSCVAFMPLESLGPGVYAARMAYASGIAGMFTCSVVHICTGVRVERRAELIGTLGVSGFLGMIVGPRIGDWIFRSGDALRGDYVLMFALSALLGAVYLGIVVYLTRHSRPPVTGDHLPIGRVLIEHWPGVLVAVAMMMGIGQVVHSTFLTRFRDARDLEGISVFFLFYAPTAILLRLAGGRWFERVGRRRATLVALGLLATSMLLYPEVATEWNLVWPALAAGSGHAILFPCVTTLGAEAFPERYRATGTTLILGFMDVGILCGAPTLGAVIDRFGFDAMFFTAATVIGTVGVAFAASSLARWRRNELPVGTSPGTAADVADW